MTIIICVRSIQTVAEAGATRVLWAVAEAGATRVLWAVAEDGATRVLWAIQHFAPHTLAARPPRGAYLFCVSQPQPPQPGASHHPLVAASLFAAEASSSSSFFSFMVSADAEAAAQAGPAVADGPDLRERHAPPPGLHAVEHPGDGDGHRAAASVDLSLRQAARQLPADARAAEAARQAG